MRLRPCAAAQAAFAKTATIRTPAIPLGKAASSSGAEDFNAHGRRTGKRGLRCKPAVGNKKTSALESSRYTRMLEGLELGVGVRADFAVEVDLFVLRGNPFHERRSLKFNDKREHSMSARIAEEGKTLRARPESWGCPAGLAQHAGIQTANGAGHKAKGAKR